MNRVKKIIYGSIGALVIAAAVAIPNVSNNFGGNSILTNNVEAVSGSESFFSTLLWRKIVSDCMITVTSTKVISAGDLNIELKKFGLDLSYNVAPISNTICTSSTYAGTVARCADGRQLCLSHSCK